MRKIVMKFAFWSCFFYFLENRLDFVFFPIIRKVNLSLSTQVLLYFTLVGVLHKDLYFYRDVMSLHYR